MARLIPGRDIAPILAAARTWMDTCLIADGSVLSTGSLWTPPLIEEVRRAFVEHPDEGDGEFLQKLAGQMQAASPDSKKLTAELLWALLLFPSKISSAKKSKQVREVWESGGEKLPATPPQLDDAVLLGIGSAGIGFNTHRWRELAYLITLAENLKQREIGARRIILSDYDAFIEWISAQPSSGDRQFRHMLRYFAFPDRVERISSSGDRRAILEGFDGAPGSAMRGWSDREVDEALLKLRKRLETERPGQVVDFYESELKRLWKKDKEKDDVSTRTPSPPETATQPSAAPAGQALNLILYGPPGTGKTYALVHEYFPKYESVGGVDVERLVDSVADLKWWEVTALALDALGGRANVTQLMDHSFVRAKVRQRGRTANVRATVWGHLQSHTRRDSSSVKFAKRHDPEMFDKEPDSTWKLIAALPDELAQARERLRQVDLAHGRTIEHRSFVTFHQSFGYEDFVEGIRPRLEDDDEESLAYSLLPGVFRVAVDKALSLAGWDQGVAAFCKLERGERRERMHGARKYALFIDEINRGNVSRILGELITLLEPDKRLGAENELIVELPYSRERFGVPANLDVIGTMNTADRSVEALDTALRRRFEFRELRPRPELLDDFVIEGVRLGAMLRTINLRIEALYDRDHAVGHAYLLPLKQTPTLDALRAVFRTRLLPLLEEYFHRDFSRIGLVLGAAFVESTLLDDNTFADFDGVVDGGDRALLRLRDPSEINPAGFRTIYERGTPTRVP